MKENISKLLSASEYMALLLFFLTGFCGMASVLFATSLKVQKEINLLYIFKITLVCVHDCQFIFWVLVQCRPCVADITRSFRHRCKKNVGKTLKVQPNPCTPEAKTGSPSVAGPVLPHLLLECYPRFHGSGKTFQITMQAGCHEKNL